MPDVKGSPPPVPPVSRRQRPLGAPLPLLFGRLLDVYVRIRAATPVDRGTLLSTSYYIS